MRKYKVQWAYCDDIGEPVIHRDESMARGEVAHLLGTWIRRRLEDYLAKIDSDKRIKRYPDLEEGIRYLAPELKRLMEEGLVWDAYALWEDFYIRFENTLGYPLYVMLGTVIVEGSRGTGLKNRIPLLERMDVSPQEKYVKGPLVRINRTEELKNQMLMELIQVIGNKANLKGIEITPEQFIGAIESTDRKLQNKFPYLDEESEAQYIAELRDGILKKIFPKALELGYSLGVMQRWLVQYADFGGVWHPGHHTNEDRAKYQAREYLEILINHLSTNVVMQESLGRNPKYVEAAEAIIHRVEYLLQDDLVWAAYLEYKEFEQYWNHSFKPFPLEMAIGTMRVIPEPEPEPMA